MGWFSDEVDEMLVSACWYTWLEETRGITIGWDESEGVYDKNEVEVIGFVNLGAVNWPIGERWQKILW